MHSREQELVEDGGWCTSVCVAGVGGWMNIRSTHHGMLFVLMLVTTAHIALYCVSSEAVYIALLGAILAWAAVSLGGRRRRHVRMYVD